MISIVLTFEIILNISLYGLTYSIIIIIFSNNDYLKCNYFWIYFYF